MSAREKMESTPSPPQMQLIGGQRLIAGDGFAAVVHFYGDLFRRLGREVRHIGNLIRYVGFQRLVGGQNSLHFFGIEVDKIEAIPEGLVAWDFNDDTWTGWAGQSGQDVVTWQEHINWQWFNQAPAGRRRSVGEFTAPLPKVWGHAESSNEGAFWISANAYVELPESEVSNDDVYLVDYDPTWPQQFTEFARWLRDHLGPDIVLRVEHFGSTAIPGLPAKPIIDVLVEVPSFATAKQRAVPLFNNEQWEYWWYAGHMMFIKRKKLMGRRTHHLHMAPQGHRLWEGLAFRDYLRANPQEARRYATLKQALAAHYQQDRERYTQAKTKFVQEVTARALK
ncbi:MAG: GrpB family protein [Anaerolineae bacterium]|nr:GrpB family protein [Anaerolineae bacterium]